MKPVEVLAWFSCEGNPKPIRFRFLQQGAYKTVKVDRIVQETEEKLAGIRTRVYRCQSLVQETEKVYELKYEINTCKWYLYKI